MTEVTQKVLDQARETFDAHLSEEEGRPLVQKTYWINEVFTSLQGEGIRAGTVNTFIRFTGCNQTCKVETHGFDCDTEFASGRKVTLKELWEWIRDIQAGTCETGAKDVKWVILTGGEPGLQVDKEFIDYFHSLGYQLAIESNGSIELPLGLDWITVSPKVAEHAVRQKTAHEVKYVRGYGQAIPKTTVEAGYYLISPAFNGTSLDPKTLEWCIQLCLKNPKWRLSVQRHKNWRVA